MDIKVIHSDNFSEGDINDIRSLLLANTDPSGNYDVDDWENKPHTFLYVFLRGTRFHKENGGMVLAYDNGKICGMSGFHKSHFHPDIFVLGSRTMIDKSYRHQLLINKYLSPIQLESVRDKAKMVVWLFDRHTKFSMYDVVVSGKIDLFLHNKTNEFSIIKNLQSVMFPVKLFDSTTHNVLYVKLDDKFEYDWESIRAQDV